MDPQFRSGSVSRTARGARRGTNDLAVAAAVTVVVVAAVAVAALVIGNDTVIVFDAVDA